MRYVSFIRPNGGPSFGRLDKARIIDLGDPEAGGRLKDAIAADVMGDLVDNMVYELDEVRLLPPIPNPGKILCIGLNYINHITEMGRKIEGYPAVFTRWADTLIADGEPLVRPREGQQFDFEGELAVVIGKPGRRIERQRALEHVAGYSIFHDASLRDWQRHNSQFTPGKNFPRTGAFGPALVTGDEIADLGAQRVQTRLNGELMQDQPIADMIFDVPAIVAYCSTFTPLNPGDVIATGTPGGVGLGRTPPVFMRHGDHVEICIGTIGTLRNSVIDEVS